MPRKPLFNSHGKLILVFVHLLDDGDGLNDGLVLSVYIELDVVAGVGVC
jgi:hypothetical protein